MHGFKRAERDLQTFSNVLSLVQLGEASRRRYAAPQPERFRLKEKTKSPIYIGFDISQNSYAAPRLNGLD